MKFSSVLKGLFGTLALLGFYFAVVSFVSGWNFALEQFFGNWYWILALATGFGIQIGLFSYLRALHRAQKSGRVIAVSGATSGIAMISCCAHYLVNILPIIGISGFAAVVGQYQTELFALGLLANIGGIDYMLRQLKKLRHE